MPLGRVGVTWLPHMSTHGTFLSAMCCFSWSLYFLKDKKKQVNKQQQQKRLILKQIGMFFAWVSIKHQLQGIFNTKTIFQCFIVRLISLAVLSEESYSATSCRKALVKKWLQMFPALNISSPPGPRRSAVISRISLYSTTWATPRTLHTTPTGSAG